MEWKLRESVRYKVFTLAHVLYCNNEQTLWIGISYFIPPAFAGGTESKLAEKRMQIATNLILLLPLVVSATWIIRCRW